MDHAYFRDRVSAFHDRELPPQELVIVEEHIRDCAECQALLSEVEKLDQLVARHVELAGSDYWEKSAQKIEQRLGFVEPTEITPVRKAGWDRGLVWKVSAIAASLAVIVFIGINKDRIIKEDQVLPDRTIPSEVPIVVPADTSTDSIEGSVARVQDKVQVEAENKVQRSAERTKQQAGETDRQGQVQAGRQVEPPKEELVTRPPTTAPAPEQQQQDADREAVSDENYKDVQPLAVEPEVRKERLQEDVAQSAPQETSGASKQKSVQQAQESPERQRTTAKQPAPAAGAAEAPRHYADSASDRAGELAVWQSRRDSLSAQLQSTDAKLLNKYSVTSLIKQAESPNKRLLRTALVAPSPEDKTATEKAYLEATYHVALLTADGSEYESARQALETASRQKSASARLARQLLGRLSEQRPDPPRN